MAPRISREHVMKAAAGEASSNIHLPLGDDPPRVTPEVFTEWALACARAGFADLTLQTEQPPRGNLHGDMMCLGHRPWSTSEMTGLLCEIYGSESVTATLAAGEVLDFAWHAPEGRGIHRSFRINATAIRPVRGGSGVEVTLRVLPNRTPTLESVGLDKEVVKIMSPDTGVVILAGATGAGKSTTMAALLRTHLEGDRPRKIVDIQAPIEFTFADVLRRDTAASFGQSEIGRHVRDWAAGVRGALRRAPHVICLGEARDLETIRAVLEAAMTGHLVVTTTHAGSLTEVFRRLVTVFDPGSREAMAFDLVCAVKAIMVQRLEPAPDGGRVPLRAILEVTPELRRRLLAAKPDAWPGILDCWTATGSDADGLVQSFAGHAAALAKTGALSQGIAERHARR